MIRFHSVNFLKALDSNILICRLRTAKRVAEFAVEVGLDDFAIISQGTAATKVKMSEKEAQPRGREVEEDHAV